MISIFGKEPPIREFSLMEIAHYGGHEALAVSVATHALHGQKDMAGLPAIYHALRVGLAGDCVNTRIVGFLHDVVEDSPITLEGLRHYFPQVIVSGVDAMTRRDGETYADYVMRVNKCPLGRMVKLNDLHDNITRPGGKASLRKRHERAREYILGRRDRP